MSNKINVSSVVLVCFSLKTLAYRLQGTEETLYEHLFCIHTLGMACVACVVSPYHNKFKCSKNPTCMRVVKYSNLESGI